MFSPPQISHVTLVRSHHFWAGEPQRFSCLNFSVAISPSSTTLGSYPPSVSPMNMKTALERRGNLAESCRMWALDSDCLDLNPSFANLLVVTVDKLLNFSVPQ